MVEFLGWFFSVHFVHDVNGVTERPQISADVEVAFHVNKDELQAQGKFVVTEVSTQLTHVTSISGVNQNNNTFKMIDTQAKPSDAASQKTINELCCRIVRAGF